MWTLRSLRSLVLGSHCVIEIDHRPLASLCRTSTTLLDRVYAELEDYSYELKYVPGHSIISDGLSRQEDHSKCKLCKGQEAVTTKDTMCVTDINALFATSIDSSSLMQVLDLTDAAQPTDKLPNQPTDSNRSSFVNISTEQVLSMQKQDYYVKALLVYMKFGKLPDKPEFRQWVLKMFPNATIRHGIVGILEDGRFKILAPLSYPILIVYWMVEND